MLYILELLAIFPCCLAALEANHDPTSASKRWHGARKLLKKSCEELPKLDPVTGEDVPWMVGALGAPESVG